MQQEQGLYIASPDKKLQFSFLVLEDVLQNLKLERPHQTSSEGEAREVVLLGWGEHRMGLGRMWGTAARSPAPRHAGPATHPPGAGLETPSKADGALPAPGDPVLRGCSTDPERAQSLENSVS